MSPAQVEQRRRNVAQIAATRRAATQCNRGHEYTPHNTYTRLDNGRRECLTCRDDRNWYFRHGLRVPA